ncbi:hypothetical protein ACVME8_010450 [Bradyrhizobium diazoefficiens]
MLDIGSSDTLKYDFGRSYTIQIYKDNQDAKKHYIVPQPHFAIAASGLPEFSLRQFKTDKGVSGQCNFQTVLQTPPGAIEDVQKKFGSDIRIGGWDWTLGNGSLPVSRRKGPDAQLFSSGLALSGTDDQSAPAAPITVVATQPRRTLFQTRPQHLTDIYTFMNSQCLTSHTVKCGHTFHLILIA